MREKLMRPHFIVAIFATAGVVSGCLFSEQDLSPILAYGNTFWILIKIQNVLLDLRSTELGYLVLRITSLTFLFFATRRNYRKVKGIVVNPSKYVKQFAYLKITAGVVCFLAAFMFVYTEQTGGLEPEVIFAALREVSERSISISMESIGFLRYFFVFCLPLWGLKAIRFIRWLTNETEKASQ